MKRLAVLAAFALALAPVAGVAALSPAELADVTAKRTGAGLPQNLAFVDEKGAPLSLRDAMRGRPTVLIPADFKCRALCGPILTIAAKLFHDADAVAGRDFNLLVIGMDPEETPQDAEAMKASRFGGDVELAGAAHFLHGDAATLATLFKALGVRPLYHRQAGQWAHALDIFVLAADGRVSEDLPALSTDPESFRIALADAKAGAASSVVERVRILCYGLDPAHGAHNALARRLLLVACGASLAGAGLLAARMHRRARP